MRLKRVVTLGYPAALLPDDLRGQIGTAETVNVMVEEECESYDLIPADEIEWETRAQRWVDGTIVEVAETEIPQSLLEPTS